MSNSQPGMIEGPVLVGEVTPVTVAQFIREFACQLPLPYGAVPTRMEVAHVGCQCGDFK
jgi:hypothetical protein